MNISFVAPPSGVVPPTIFGAIAVPERTWKAILVLDNPGDGVADVTVDTRVIAVDIPNQQDISDNWQDFLVSVDDIELRQALTTIERVLRKSIPLIISRITRSNTTMRYLKIQNNTFILNKS